MTEGRGWKQVQGAFDPTTKDTKEYKDRPDYVSILLPYPRDGMNSVSAPARSLTRLDCAEFRDDLG